MAEHLIFDTGTDIFAAPLTDYQSEQVMDWMLANPGVTWTPETFGWVFSPWMLKRCELISRE